MLRRIISVKLLIFVAILTTAAFLRLFALDQNPPALNWDEVSHGYNAYSILKTGKDEWGQSFPLASFRAFGDYKLPVYIYLTVPSIAIFGLNEWGVRAPAALFGILAVLGTFLLTQKLFNNFKLSAVSSLLLAVSPWHLLLSRAALEANIALTLTIFGIYFFIKSLPISKVGLDNPKLLLLSSLFFGLTFYSYYAARIVVPILVLGLAIIYWAKIKAFKTQLIAPFAIFLFFFISIIPSSISVEGQARFYWTTILDQGAINRINESRITSNLPQVLNLAVNNKPVYFISNFVPNYLSHFSPQFLFFQGGSNFQYSIPGRGVLYFFEIPLLIFGVVALLKLRNNKTLIIALWLLVGPIAASLTRESPNVLRSILILPTFQIIAALGFFEILKYANNNLQKILIVGLVVTIATSSAFFLRDYWGVYRQNYSFAWQYGYSQLAQFLQFNKENYDRIVITKKYGEPHEFLLYNLQIDPKFYQNDPNLIRCPRSNWFWVDRFDKYEFVNDWEVKNLKKDEILPTACPQEVKKLGVGKMLVVTSPGNFPAGGKQIKTFYFLNDTPAFDLVEY